MKNFEVKSYGVAELACLYLPALSKQSASNRLRNWINCNEKLKQDLNINGFRKRQKVYTPKQVSIIVENLGIP